MYKILLVEDDFRISQMLCDYFSDKSKDDIYIDVASDGATGIEKAFENTYDLLLLDVMLPEMDGFEICREVRRFSDVPIMFITARCDQEDILNGYALGCDDYIVKPFEILEVLVRIEKVLERRNKVESKVFLKDLEIDFKERTVKRFGEEIHLKPMEFNLLETLIKNKNIAISREKLLDIVWGYEYLGEVHTVDVHIGQLRKKLDLKDVIKTVSRYGYRLEEGE
jgi:DNA-binding response OmpR family regulator